LALDSIEFARASEAIANGPPHSPTGPTYRTSGKNLLHIKAPTDSLGTKIRVLATFCPAGLSRRKGCASYVDGHVAGPAGTIFRPTFWISGFAGPAQIAGAIEAISGAAGVKTK
jgi:hypothetical protein